MISTFQLTKPLRLILTHQKNAENTEKLLPRRQLVPAHRAPQRAFPTGLPAEITVVVNRQNADRSPQSRIPGPESPVTSIYRSEIFKT